MERTTIIFQTFKRPAICQRLLDSIQKHYPSHVPDFVIVNDDSEQDNGLSWGRNFLVKQAKTEYVMLIDDDAEFTEMTNIKLLEQMMDETQLDILGFACGFDYIGSYKVEGRTVTLLPQQNEQGRYDYVPNMFIARRESLLQHPWDEELKIGEHFAYFYEHYPNLKIDYTDQVSIKHEHISNPDYAKYRGRALQYAKRYMQKKGISKIVRIKK